MQSVWIECPKYDDETIDAQAKGPEIYEELEKLEKLLRQEAVLISKDRPPGMGNNT